MYSIPFLRQSILLNPFTHNNPVWEIGESAIANTGRITGGGINNAW